MRLARLLLVPALLLALSPLGAETPPDPEAEFAPAIALFQAGQKDGAAAEGEQRIAADRAAYGSDNPALAPHLRELAHLYLRLNAYAKAEALLKEALALRTAHARESDDPEVASAALELGWFYSNLAAYDKARPLFDQALGIRQRKFGPDRPATAEVLNALAVMEENRADYPAAEKLYLDALAIQEERLGPDHAATTTTVNNLATLYWSMGNNEKAALYFTRALNIRERTLGPTALVTSTSLNNLALLYRSLGAYGKAEPLLRRVLAIRRTKLGADHPFTLTTVSLLGLIYRDLHRNAEAEPLLSQAAELRRRILGPGPDTARSLFQLACLYDDEGRYAEAEPLHREALAMRLGILGTRHPETAGSYAYLGRHFHLLGDLTQARENYDRALAIDLPVLGPVHADTLTTLADRAALELDMGDMASARRDARAVADAWEKLRSSLFSFTTEQQRLDLQGNRPASNLAVALGDADNVARIAFRSKGVVLDSLIEERTAAAASGDPEIGRLTSRLRDIAHRLASPVSDDARDGLEAERMEAQDALTRRLFGPGSADGRALQADVPSILGALPAGTALVEWVRYDAYEGRLRWKPSYGAIVVAPGVPTAWISVGDAGEIAAAIGRYRKAMRRKMSDAAVSRILADLHARLWAPVAAALPPGTTRVLVSPDGELNSVSFATLLDGNGRFLEETTSLAYVSSGRDLLRPPAPNIFGPKRLAVFADPDFRTGKGPDRDDDLDPLPGTRKEARFLLDHAGEWGLEPSAYLGPAATKRALAELAAPFILHLATHGRVCDADSFPALPPRDPMQRSLVFLAGAQNTLDAWGRGVVPPPDDDGILTAEEAASLPLQGTSLVVLSACDTGEGESVAGEGVLGLRRGFILAGARHLLLTIWPVSDAATVPLIEDFYARYAAGADPGDALAAAQRRQLTELREAKGIGAAARQAGPFILNF